MEGLIANFRMSRHRKSNNQMVVHVDGIGSRDKASQMAGKKVVWKTPSGKDIKGEVRGAHGNSGALRVWFEQGMPGQAIGSKVEIG